MYAMHYAITLPADYDMGIIRERIASKGPLLDTLPGLGFKAYLVRERGRNGSAINQYATFYLWTSIDGMGGFLWGGRGFSSIVASFSRPPVRHWTGVTCLPGRAALDAARFATILEDAMAEDIDPAIAVSSAQDAMRARADDPAVCLLALAVDPQAWRIVEFTLWAQQPKPEAGTCYEVGHLSKPEIGAILPG